MASFCDKEKIQVKPWDFFSEVAKLKAIFKQTLNLVWLLAFLVPSSKREQLEFVKRQTENMCVLQNLHRKRVHFMTNLPHNLLSLLANRIKMKTDTQKILLNGKRVKRQQQQQQQQYDDVYFFLWRSWRNKNKTVTRFRSMLRYKSHTK